jgi:hypothetical protein
MYHLENYKSLLILMGYLSVTFVFYRKEGKNLHILVNYLEHISGVACQMANIFAQRSEKISV